MCGLDNVSGSLAIRSMHARTGSRDMKSAKLQLTTAAIRWVTRSDNTITWWGIEDWTKTTFIDMKTGRVHLKTEFRSN